MKFDKSKVFTSLNANKLKVGSKVIVADTMDELKQYVESDCDASIIDCIMPEYFSNRFCSDDKYYNLAYLISETEEKKLKWTDLKIGDVVKQIDSTISYLITGIDSFEESTSHVLVNGTWVDDDCLEYWEKVEK